MKYGFSEKQLTEITDIFSTYPEIETAILFGSRVINTYKEASDVDIAIQGERVDVFFAAELKDHFEEETYLPFFFDVVAYDSINSEELKQHIRGKGIVIYRKGGSEWKECKLEGLGLLQRGRSRHRPRYAFHLYGGKYPFIQTGEIRAAKKYVTKFEQTYSEAGLEQSKLWPKDTLCITIAANIAELAILSFDACFPDSVLGFIPNDELADLDFIYYTLTHFQRELKQVGEGSVQDNINLGTFQNIFFPIPPLPEQKAIASVLSCLDDKIDLFHRQNLTLEAMAETLFRQWFVEEAQEDWEEKLLGEFFPVVTGKRNANYSTEDGQYPFFTCSQEILKAPGYSFEGKAIMLSGNGDFNVKRCDGKFEAYQRTYVLMPFNKKYFNFLFVLIKYFLAEITGGHQGSVINFITKGMITDFKFQIPRDDLRNELTILDRIYGKVDYNHTQIRTLEKLRDTLLPKLMSGEVRIQYNGNEH